MSTTVSVRLSGGEDEESIAAIRAEALGVSPDAPFLGHTIHGARIWLAEEVDESGAISPIGFCRMVPDFETRSRGRGCVDALYVSPSKRCLGAGRALIGEVIRAAYTEDLGGIWLYLSPVLPERFVSKTSGIRLRTLRLLRHGQIASLAEAERPANCFIRPASIPADLDLLARIYNRAFDGMWNFYPHTARNVASWFEVPDTIPNNCLVLEEAGEGIGMAVLTVEPARIEAGDRTGYIPDIGLVATHRKRGLGRALMGAVATRAKALNLEGIELIADETDKAARSFYNALGFEEHGTINVYEWRCKTSESESFL